nr:serine/arginine repetitive matrix protein 1-like [Penaeus vannamei]
MSRTPTSPLCREPPSPNARSTPSPVSPRSVGGRHFRYDVWADQRGLRRRSSLLTVPSTHDPPADLHLRLPRQRSSSIAGPLRPPDLVRRTSSLQLNKIGPPPPFPSPGGLSVPVGVGAAPPAGRRRQRRREHLQQLRRVRAGGRRHEPAVRRLGGRRAPRTRRGGATPSAPSGLRSGHVSPGSFAGYPTPDPFAGDSARRRNSSADPATGVCRLRQFSHPPPAGGVVNRGDSPAPSSLRLQHVSHLQPFPPAVGSASPEPYRIVSLVQGQQYDVPKYHNSSGSLHTMSV